MPATDTTLWDYAVSYGGPSLFMTAVFLTVMPLVWFKFARPRLRRWPSRLAVMLSVWMFAWFIAYGDVLLIAREAKRVCEAEAGLRVYRTVEADGFAGSNDIRKWAARGFRYVEELNEGTNSTLYKLVDGNLSVSISEKAISTHEYITVSSVQPYQIVRRAELVRSIQSREVLGERVMFAIPVGWLDRMVTDGLGFRRQPVWCVDKGVVTSQTSNYLYSEVIEKTLKPKP